MPTLLTDTRFEKIPAHDVVGIRVIISSDEITDLFDRGFAEIRKMLTIEGIEPVGPGRAYYFGEVSDTVDILIGFPVSPVQADTLRRGALSQSGGDIDDIVLHHFRDMKTFHSRHTGVYDGLQETWNQAFTEIEEIGCRVPAVTVGWEEYVTTPCSTQNPETMITDVFVQVCQVPAEV